MIVNICADKIENSEKYRIFQALKEVGENNDGDDSLRNAMTHCAFVTNVVDVGKEMRHSEEGNCGNEDDGDDGDRDGHVGQAQRW